MKDFDSWLGERTFVSLPPIEATPEDMLIYASIYNDYFKNLNNTITLNLEPMVDILAYRLGKE